MRRKILCIVMALVLCLGLLPGTASAAEAFTETLDFTNDSTAVSGDGYIWDKETNTLTLNDFSLVIPAGENTVHGIVLPADTTLVLEGSSTIENNARSGRCLECRGSLTIKGDGELNLQLNGYITSGIGRLKVDGNVLTFESGTVNIKSGYSGNTSYAIQYGIEFPHIAVTGGTLNITNVYKSIWDADGSSNNTAVYRKILEVSGGRLSISVEDDWKYNPGSGITVSSHPRADGKGVLSVTGGEVDISGVSQAVSCDNADISVTGGSFRIHDLKPNSQKRSYGFTATGSLDIQTTIDLTGGDVSVTGCSYLTNIFNQNGPDAVKFPEGQAGLAWVNRCDETTGQFTEQRVRIYGDYTLDTDILLYPNTGGPAWILDMAEGSTLTIPAGKEFDISGTTAWPAGSIDLSAGKIVIGEGGTLILPSDIDPDELAEWNITGEGTAKDNAATPVIFPKVTFLDKSEGEAQTLQSSLIYPNTKITHQPTVVKEGYSVEGWYKDEAFETEWDFDSDTVTADITLYAKWIPDTHTITFDSQDGSEPTESTAEYGTRLTEPEAPEREHYTFGGWYKETACENAWDFDADTVDGDITLYAKWIPDTHTITFDSQDGSEPTESAAEYGTRLTEPEAPEREHYTFGGWYKEAACENAWGFDADTVDRDITLYAKWIPDTHTITFDSQGGSALSATQADYGAKLVRPADPARTGYTFGGWYKELACENAWDFENDTVTEEVTLYAKWTQNTPSGTGGGSGASVPSVQPVKSNTTEDGTSATETTVAPTATSSGGTASASVNAATGSEIVKQAAANDSDRVVIAPQISGDVTKTEVSIPASTVGEIGSKTGADLIISTPVAEVTIPNDALESLSAAGGTVAVTAEEKDGAVELTVTAGGRAVEDIPGGLTLTVPLSDAAPGTVAVLIREDGTRQVVRKSVAEGESITVPLDGSAKLEIADNGKQYSDVPAGSWAADAVAFVSARELFSGTGEGQFSPDLPMSRGMLAVVLYNLESNPEQAVTGVFSDVSDSAWYARGVEWAASNGIVSGYGNGLFGPNENITREQLAVMLWRYAGRPAAADKVLDFKDADAVSSYALEAMRWAVGSGILNGYGNGLLDPQGPATRAQAAQMLKNFMSK